VSDRAEIAQLYRRVGFGLASGQLDALEAVGIDRALDLLVDPDEAGLAPQDDPWADVSVGRDAQGRSVPADGDRGSIVAAIDAWLDAMAATHRPFEEWMRWFWHGHFVSALQEVKAPELMVEQLRLFGRLGLGDFRSLLRAVTVDGAMLRYLDGTENKIDAVNENYAREVLELFTLGVGNFTEADVRAGAEALTGWTAQQNGVVQFVAKRHDDRPKTYLGRQGVHDVDTVVDAIVEQPSCAVFVTRQLADAVLGPGVDDGRVERLAAGFRDDQLQLRPLVRRLLEEGIDGGWQPTYVAPVPWLASMARATGVVPSQVGKPHLTLLRSAGQVPLQPPNVGGWPSGRAWLGSSTSIARCSLATFVAEATASDHPVRSSLARQDVRTAADSLGLPDGFLESTERAVVDATSSDGDTAALAVALGSPDLAVVTPT
jgi:uncharacterized protein (DUF1800 family)